MRASVLWTGGKDSALAFYKARMAGHNIVNLLTFVPENADFLAHPVSFMKYQSASIGIPHHEVVVEAPLEDSYEEAISSFKKRFDIQALITGDIAQIDGQANWVIQRCKNKDIEVLMPLWGSDRYDLFTELLNHGFRAIISCIKNGSLPDKWLGRDLDREALEELRKLNIQTGIDICGENGEYHTLVVDGPIFNKSIVVGKYSKNSNGSVMYVKPSDITLKGK